MEKLKQALNNYDYLTISDMYLQGEIKKDNLTNYKLIQKILFSRNAQEKSKNKDEREQDFLMIKLIIERSGFDVSFRPERKKPILYSALNRNNKKLSIYIAKLLEDKDIEFDFPETLNPASSSLIKKNNKTYSAIGIAVVKKNIDFLKYLFLERKFLQNNPYFYNSQGYLIDNDEMYFKRTPILEALIGFKTLMEELSTTQYAEKIEFSDIEKLLLMMTSRQYNLNKIGFVEKYADKIIKEPDTYEKIINSLWLDLKITKQGNKGFYKHFLNNTDPYKKIFKRDGSRISLIENIFKFNAHSWIETLIDNKKITTSQIKEFLEDEYEVLDLKDSLYNSLTKKDQPTLDKEIAKTFDLLINKKIFLPREIVENKKIMEKIGYMRNYVSTLEKSIIKENIDVIKERKINIPKKRL